MSEILKPKDVVSAKLGKVYVIIDGTRELWLNVKNIKVTASIENADVPRLGTTKKGSRNVGLSYSGTMTIYKVHSAVDDMVQHLADTGEVPYFDIQGVNEDPTAKNGRDVKLFKDCNIEGDIDIFGLDSEAEWVEQEVNITVDSVQPLEKFANSTSIIAG